MLSRPRLLLIVATCLALSWWLAHPRVDLPKPAVATSTCPLPPRVGRSEPPLQTSVPPGLRLPTQGTATLTPLAGFSVAARVLGREDYRFGHEANFSPTDLALGWGRMSEDAVLDRLEIRQGGRWYHYRWQPPPPIPPAEIANSSANMHIVPAAPEVREALARVRVGQRIRIDGWLVRIDDGRWHWVSSLRRDDTGNGACELVYACAITPL